MEKDGNIRAISRGIAVLQAINRSGSLTMMEIAKAVDLAYPTACRIVDTLVEHGMIEREATRKRYRPTALVKTLSLGYQREDELALTARPNMEALTRELHWPVSICSRVGMNMMIRGSTHSMTSLTFNIYHSGYTLPILNSSSGKVYLAFCSEEEREIILDGLCQVNRDTPRNMIQIDRILDSIRERGLGVHDKLQHTANPGRTSSISAPIFDRTTLTGTLTMIYFSSVMAVDRAVEQFGEAVKNCAYDISQKFNCPTQPNSYHQDAFVGMTNH